MSKQLPLFGGLCAVCGHPHLDYLDDEACVACGCDGTQPGYEAMKYEEARMAIQQKPKPKRRVVSHWLDFERCQATARRTHKRCRNRQVADGLCAVHARLPDPPVTQQGLWRWLWDRLRSRR